MFPWHGEGKSSSFLLATSQRQQQQQQQQQPQAQAQAQRQSSPQQSSSRQDGGTGYGRWRLSSVLQQGQGQDVNEKTSSNSQTNDRVTESSPREEPVPSSGDDDEEEEEEDGEAEEQGESEGGDIDFRASRNEANPAASVSNNSTNGTEQQGQRQGQRLGERVPPLGYPPQPSFRNNHARRLNTEEEIKLFELCIKNSATFGERSKLCEWWKNIANEFIENYGGPYSWHSVRRKVDLVTRQRIKYLADLKEGKIEADQATEPWKKVLDEWIPTWEKFEIAEKRRIEVRDARAASRKRKEPSGAASGSSPSSPAPSSATKRTSTTAAAPPPGSWQATPQRWIPAPYGPGPYPPPPGPGYMGPPPPSTPGMKLPDGYDTMFRTPAPHPSTHPLYPHPPPQPYYPPPNAIPQGPATAVDSNLTSAVLETLAKLNKHLEKADSTSSPIVTALTGSNDKNNKDTNNNSNTTAQDGTTSPPSSSSEGAEAEAAESTEQTTTISSLTWKKFHAELRTEFETELAKMREAFTAKLDALEQTQEMIMEMLRQEPGREGST